MGYRKADEVLPKEIIELIQQYVDGQSIYIPRRADNRQGWGANTQTRQEILDRDRAIYHDFLDGWKVSELACKYYLSEKSIQRIVRTMKKKRLRSSDGAEDMFWRGYECVQSDRE